MKAITLFLCISLFFTSCAVYRQNFDCPPDTGVPCTSVSDLEQMVIETAIGPDIFFGTNPKQHQLKDTPPSNRIWISDETERGHYIYINQEAECCIR